jgi:hypothetical protein
LGLLFAAQLAPIPSPIVVTVLVQLAADWKCYWWMGQQAMGLNGFGLEEGIQLVQV